jgi:hypothetical protein
VSGTICYLCVRPVTLANQRVCHYQFTGPAILHGEWQER